MFKYDCNVRKRFSGYASKVELGKYSRLHGEFNCHFCQQQISYAPQLMRHELSCRSNPASDNLAKGTKQTSHKQVTGICPMCPWKSPIQSHVAAHYLTTHLNLEMPAVATCPLCHKRFYQGDQSKPRPGNLLRHLLACHDTTGLDSSRIFTCVQCPTPADFRDSPSLSMHTAEVHLRPIFSDSQQRKSTGKEFSCEECKQGF